MVLFELGGFESVARDARIEEREKEEQVYTCVRCGSMITRASDEEFVGASFTHSFTNPHGIMYTIGCFSNAPGCDSLGPPTDEFSWFPGFAWRVCICRSCGLHMGWEFTGGNSSFFGLILNNLRAPDRS